MARKIEKLAKESWKPAGLSPSHAYLLILTFHEPGIQPGSLSEQLQLEPSTITRLIDKLEEAKLVVRVTEGKSSSIYPTQKAKELQPLFSKCRSHFEIACSKLLKSEEQTKMTQLFNKVSDKI